MIKIKRSIIIALVCVFLCLLSFTACGSDKLDGQSELLGKPREVERVDYSALNTDGYKAFVQGVEKFARTQPTRLRRKYPSGNSRRLERLARTAASQFCYAVPLARSGT